MDSKKSGRKRNELIIQVNKLVHRLGARFWFGFALFSATTFGILALAGLVSGELLFSFSALATGGMFCTIGIIFYRYCKIMISIIHQNDVYWW